MAVGHSAPKRSLKNLPFTLIFIYTWEKKSLLKWVGKMTLDQLTKRRHTNIFIT